MGKLNKDNLRKTIYYLKKNGLKNTIYAMAERLQKKDTDSYTYMAPSEEELKEQRERIELDRNGNFETWVRDYRRRHRTKLRDHVLFDNQTSELLAK